MPAKLTQLELAKKGNTTALIKKAAKQEPVSPEFIRQGIAKGIIVVPANKSHPPDKPCAIGTGVKTKVNANIGTSQYCCNISLELAKLKNCITYKADTVMDLSIGGDLHKIRKAILDKCPLPLGTVPIYEVAMKAQDKGVPFHDVSVDDMFEVVEQQAKDRVDFFTIHCGVTIESLRKLKQSKRITGIVSRGGALMAVWIERNKKENPFYEYYDRLLDILKRYDITLSLGDGLRPGSLADATDKPQIAELAILGRLVVRARKQGVQVMVEGPGHIPINQIRTNVQLEKSIAKGAPFYVLGPLVTDIGCGYDHITSAIGGAIAASYGADFLCYVTPSEHLSIPDASDVKEGIIASRIAAHAADIAKGIPGQELWDLSISKLRRQRKWKQQIQMCIDPKKAYEIYSRIKLKKKDICTMCGDYCPMKIYQGRSTGQKKREK